MTVTTKTAAEAQEKEKRAMITLPEDEFRTLLERIEKLETGNKGFDKDFADRLGAAIANGNGAKTGGRMYDRMPVRVEDIDKDDILDKPVVFFKYAHSHFIPDDVRNGQPVQTPYGRIIKFRNISYHQNKGTSKFDKNVIFICCATIRSKKEADWLRHHTDFNITFFENMKTATDQSPMEMKKLNDANMRTSSMSKIEIIDLARSYGLPMDMDVDSMRRAIVFKMAGMYQEPQAARPLPNDPEFDDLVVPHSYKMVNEFGRE